MKKTLVSALTTALVVGAASTTFAAANPFADVPADHWAYDAVSQLADAGIVDGYLDGSFKGQQGMSRYEMAQIVAKAMTKSDKADAATKAQIDKLAAEFGDELANLGVRIDSLEKKVDNVTWTGLIRYDWNNMNYAADTEHAHTGDNYIKLRLEPTFAINDNWTGHARIDYKLDNSKAVAGSAAAELDKLWVDGVYGKTTVSVGKLGTVSVASHGLVMDTEVTGAEIAYAPTAEWTIKATAAQIPAPDTELFGKNGAGKANFGRYGAIEVDYNNGKVDAGIGYHHFAATNMSEYLYNDKQSVGVTDLGVGYKFDKNWYAFADYSFAPNFDEGTVAKESATSHNAYNIQVNYKGADAAVPHSWGAYIAYRQLAPFASAFATQDNSDGKDMSKTLKGWEIEASYAFAKNIVGEVKYFMGKDTLLTKTGLGDQVRGVWTRVDFLF